MYDTPTFNTEALHLVSNEGRVKRILKITPLVIYGLRGVHTHILWWNEKDYKQVLMFYHLKTRLFLYTVLL